MFGRKARQAQDAAAAQRHAEHIDWFIKASRDDYESDVEFYGTDKANSNRHAAQNDLAMRSSLSGYGLVTGYWDDSESEAWTD